MLGRKSKFSTNLCKAKRHNERNGEKPQGNESEETSLETRAPKFLFSFILIFLCFVLFFVLLIFLLFFLVLGWYIVSNTEKFFCKGLSLITNDVS